MVSTIDYLLSLKLPVIYVLFAFVVFLLAIAAILAIEKVKKEWSSFLAKNQINGYAISAVAVFFLVYYQAEFADLLQHPTKNTFLSALLLLYLNLIYNLNKEKREIMLAEIKLEITKNQEKTDKEIKVLSEKMDLILEAMSNNNTPKNRSPHYPTNNNEEQS